MLLTEYTHAPLAASGLDARIMFASAGLEVIHLHLEPGEQITEHINPVEVIACLIEGEAELIVDGQATRMPLFSVARIPGNANRGLANKGIAAAHLLMIKIMQST